MTNRHNTARDVVRAFNMPLPVTDPVMCTGDVREALLLPYRAAVDFMRRYGKRIGRKYVISRSEFERIVKSL